MTLTLETKMMTNQPMILLPLREAEMAVTLQDRAAQPPAVEVVAAAVAAVAGEETPLTLFWGHHSHRYLPT